MSKEELYSKIKDLELSTKKTLENHKEHILAIVSALGLESRYEKSIVELPWGDEISKKLVYKKGSIAEADKTIKKVNKKK